MEILVVDRDEALDDDGLGAVDLDHARHEMDALEHHRPALGERAVDRRLDADEDVARLVEEPEQTCIARLLLLGLRQPEACFEARVVDGRHERR